MYRVFFAGVATCALLTSPALAGEEVIYEAAPDWVKVSAFDVATVGDGPSEILYDWQHRMEDGVVHRYYDRIVRIDNPQSLNEEGTLQLPWSPDKGDLYVHRLEIIRGGEVIDLIADGVVFDVIRREEQLEARLLDGMLTATVAVPGLQEEDTLRLAYTQTLADQALGDEMQVLQYLPRKPWLVGQARTIVSWPEGAGISWRAGPDVELAEPVLKDGYNYIEVDLPLAKREDIPSDSPGRFRRSAILRVGSFTDWQDLSRVMAPHYEEAAIIAEGSPIVDEVDKIMAAHSDPLARAAAATQLVQDQVSYLLNGLNGGNYLPQNAEETWEKRYGDCKAKSVLLHAMLQRMGIQSDVVLVDTTDGDGMPELLPLPGNFDHMIVRASIDGVDYWLDGTSTSTRLRNIGEVPAFYYALPLRSEGLDLVEMTQRPQPYPDSITRMFADHSAGPDLPILYKFEMEFSGSGAAAIEKIADADDPEVRRTLARNMAGSEMGNAQVTDISITYDDEKAAGLIEISGVGDSVFDWYNGENRLDVGLISSGVRFSPNRARPSWRSIPVATSGPALNRASMQVTLPNGGEGYTLHGKDGFDETVANTRITRNTDFSGKMLLVTEEVQSMLGEVPTAEIAAQKRKAQVVSKYDLEVRAPKDMKWRWDLEPKDLAKRVEPHAKAYGIAVDQAEDDDFKPLIARANFYLNIYDYEQALADLDTIIETQPTAQLHSKRAQTLIELGRLDAAVDDLQMAYDISPTNSRGYYLAEIMSRNGRSHEAIELLGFLPVSDDEVADQVSATSEILGRSGAHDEGFALISGQLEVEPENASLLNSDCWFRGIYKHQMDSAIEQCTKAVERAPYPAAALDSRAMVHFRLGDHAAAIEDLNAALELAPGMSAARFLRGVVKLDKGDKSGRSDVASALRQNPQLEAHYASFGVVPKM